MLIASCITPLSCDHLVVHVINATGDDIRLRAGVTCGTFEAGDDIAYREGATSERTDTRLRDRYAHFCYMTQTTDYNPMDKRNRVQSQITKSDPQNQN